MIGYYYLLHHPFEVSQCLIVCHYLVINPVKMENNAIQERESGREIREKGTGSAQMIVSC